jgi:O-antigen/teichoic acid export membrane protein
MPSMSSTVQLRDNVLYSVLDYASQPALMLVATPFLLRHLGVQQYGVWMLVNSITATASGLGGGFGDGATKYVAKYRGRGDNVGAIRSLAAVLIVHSAFGLISALAMICLAPWLIGHVFTVQPALREVGTAAVRISAALLLLRFVESVFVAAIRGCEHYRPTVIISVTGRVAVTASAIGLAATQHNLVSILWATLMVALIGLAGQAWLAHHILHVSTRWRTSDFLEGLREVSSFGAFTWVKSSVGILTSYADRLLVAGVLGGGPLAYYAVCNQLTQPVHALLAAAFNFVFPHFSAQSSSSLHQIRRRYRNANAIVLTVSAFACVMLVGGATLILRVWIGPAIAAQYHGLLRAVAVGNCLLALTIVPQYTALAFGRARAMAGVNLAAGALSLPASYLLMQRIGVLGAGLGKVVAGLVFLSVFHVARRAINSQQQSQHNAAVSAAANSAMDFAQCDMHAGTATVSTPLIQRSN